MVLASGTQCDPDKLQRNSARFTFLGGQGKFQYYWVRLVPDLLDLVEKCLQGDNFDQTSAAQLINHTFLTNDIWDLPAIDTNEIPNKELGSLEEEYLHNARFGLKMIVKDLVVPKCRKLHDFALKKLQRHPTLLKNKIRFVSSALEKPEFGTLNTYTNIVI